MTEQLLNGIRKRFPLTEKPVGEFATLKANGMTFTIKAYDAKGLGHVSVMTAKGFFGLMQMDTLIVNPTEKDLPLYSYDRILAMGNDTLIIELYDTMLEKVDLQAVRDVNTIYCDLPRRDPGQHWYDSIKLQESVSVKAKKPQKPRMDLYAVQHLGAFLDCAPTGACDPAAKREKASVYVEGLLQNGGPSTDVFLKAFGKEKTERLFRTVLFGTKA